jgi:hypothetical protein
MTSSKGLYMFHTDATITGLTTFRAAGLDKSSPVHSAKCCTVYFFYYYYFIIGQEELMSLLLISDVQIIKAALPPSNHFQSLPNFKAEQRAEDVMLNDEQVD